MIKYVSHAITFAEVPDEVCLTIQISGCPHRCEGCHSPYLREDIGEDLEKDLPDLLKQYADRITCVCLMGDGGDIGALNRVLYVCKYQAKLKTALYSGYDNAHCPYFRWHNIDYLKTGPYIASFGGLDCETTNQRMYRYTDRPPFWEDITQRFYEKGQLK